MKVKVSFACLCLLILLDSYVCGQNVTTQSTATDTTETVSISTSNTTAPVPVNTTTEEPTSASTTESSFFFTSPPLNTTGSGSIIMSAVSSTQTGIAVGVSLAIIAVIAIVIVIVLYRRGVVRFGWLRKKASANDADRPRGGETDSRPTTVWHDGASSQGDGGEESSSTDETAPTKDDEYIEMEMSYSANRTSRENRRSDDKSEVVIDMNTKKVSVKSESPLISHSASARYHSDGGNVGNDLDLEEGNDEVFSAQNTSDTDESNSDQNYIDMSGSFSPKARTFGVVHDSDGEYVPVQRQSGTGEGDSFHAVPKMSQDKRPTPKPRSTKSKKQFDSRSPPQHLPGSDSTPSKESVGHKEQNSINMDATEPVQGGMNVNTMVIGHETRQSGTDEQFEQEDIYQVPHSNQAVTSTATSDLGNDNNINGDIADDSDDDEIYNVPSSRPVRCHSEEVSSQSSGRKPGTAYKQRSLHTYDRPLRQPQSGVSTLKGDIPLPPPCRPHKPDFLKSSLQGSDNKHQNGLASVTLEEDHIYASPKSNQPAVLITD